jgi:hypothetical protein
MASAVSTVTWFSTPETVTFTQWPVIVTVLLIPLNCLIAAMAIRHNARIVHRDSDFELIAAMTNLAAATLAERTVVRGSSRRLRTTSVRSATRRTPD